MNEENGREGRQAKRYKPTSKWHRCWKQPEGAEQGALGMFGCHHHSSTTLQANVLVLFDFAPPATLRFSCGDMATELHGLATAHRIHGNTRSRWSREISDCCTIERLGGG